MSRIFLVTLITALAVGTPSFGAGFLDPGTRSLRVDATYDEDAGSEEMWGTEIGVGGGLVALDDFGVFYGYGSNDDQKLQKIGLYLEEHCMALAPVVPFIGVGTGWVYLEPDAPPAGDDTQDAWMVRGQVGLKLLINENVALAGTFLYAWSNEEIFLSDDGGLDTTNPEFSFGVRFYY